MTFIQPIHTKSQVQIFLFCLVFSAPVDAANLNIEITEIQSSQGSIWVRVFANPNDFLKKATQRIRVQPQKGSAVATISNLPEGDYALAIHHDLNDNGQMDTGLFGMPSEPYGFSNNAKGSMGAPSFEQAKFNLAPTDTLIRLKLR